MHTVINCDKTKSYHYSNLLNTKTVFYNEKRVSEFIDKMNYMARKFENDELDEETIINKIIDKKKYTPISKDLEHKKVLFNSQNRYNELLKESIYNREIKDYCNGNYAQAGLQLSYLYNEDTGENKYLFGYNFNHTLSPFYQNRETKRNLAKVTKIMKLYQEKYNAENYLYFITLTMPNIECDCQRIDEYNEMLVYANNVINNLNKKIAKIYKVNGFIKKFECTFKIRKGENEAHPHYHLLVAFTKDDGIRIKKDSESQKSLSNEIFDYWLNNFILKYFNPEDYVDKISNDVKDMKLSKDDEIKEQFRRNCRAAYDFRKCDEEKIELELAGYIAKTTKNHSNQIDYLKNQEIFDYAYLMFYRKRILTYVGCFKKINKEVKESDLLIDTVSEEERELYTHKIIFGYNRSNKDYEITHVKEISCDEDFYDEYLNNIQRKNKRKQSMNLRSSAS